MPGSNRVEWYLADDATVDQFGIVEEGVAVGGGALNNAAGQSQTVHQVGNGLRNQRKQSPAEEMEIGR